MILIETTQDRWALLQLVHVKHHESVYVTFKESKLFPYAVSWPRFSFKATFKHGQNKKKLYVRP